jgi:2-polyprenyl-6-methoxyphenol hydroxylase-like FAD-dependent oxidoreductase
MRVTIVGGGPGGLYLAGLLGERVPAVEVTLFDRGSPDDTYGFGVVFSEPTLRHLRDQDAAGFDRLFRQAARWPSIDIRIKGEHLRCEGNGFSAIQRRELLRSLADRAERAGADLRWMTELGPGAPELADADLVVIANGANSAWRTDNATRLGSTVETATAKFIWFGTTKVFDGMTFLFEENEHGWFAVHSYPYNAMSSTFVVETDEATWRAAGLDTFDTTQPPGPSDTDSAAYMERLFARHLDGGRMILNNSRWASFRTVRTRTWQLDERTVLLGDAAHTAHFSVGSGTKMAMEDALALADSIAAYAASERSLATVLKDYETERLRDVRRIQDLARPSLNWWENFAEYAQMVPAQFVFHFLTRSGRVGRDRLRRSDPDFLTRAAGHLVADPHGRVLGTPLAGRGSATGPIRLVALTASGDPEPGGGQPPGTWAAPDLGGRVSPGSASDVTIAGCDERAVWLCAPESLGELDEVLSLARPLLGPAQVVLVDAAAETGLASEALVTQQRVTEILRLRLNKTTVLVRRSVTADEAATLVLSGRADAVAVPAGNLPALLSGELAGS